MAQHETIVSVAELLPGAVATFGARAARPVVPVQLVLVTNESDQLACHRSLRVDVLAFDARRPTWPAVTLDEVELGAEPFRVVGLTLCNVSDAPLRVQVGMVVASPEDGLHRPLLLRVHR